MLKLPSNYIPYQFKDGDLTLREMTGRELSLMSKSVVSDDISYAIEAIGNLINLPDINLITVPDFYYLMLKARYMSLPSKPAAVWTCEGDMYKDIDTGVRYNLMQLESMVKAFDKDPENNKDPNKMQVETVDCKEYNSQEVLFDEFPIIHLDEDVQLDEDLDFPRVSLLPSLITALAEPEYCLTAQAAQWIKEGDTVQDKLRVLEDSPLSFYDRIAKVAQDNQYGITQTVSKACHACGTKQNHVFNIMPDMFFRI